ncbi:F-box domain-containing [Fusarium albosuccineum]|uniref:F-box domain-containing n=1 Tax=Fusarium albosuccineum TaxID=1237068 RepID=A0A8H4LLI8_9HYPO|nr:F-box domain-containing [Fusarium albosuccineum]
MMHQPDSPSRELTLDHDKEGGTDFDAWNSILDQAAARQAAQRVVIHSTPFHDHWESGTELDHETRGDWDDNGGFSNAFRAAVCRVTELPNLNTVHLRFSDKCCGLESENNWWMYDQCEMRGRRMESLRTVFSALQKRAASFDNNAIRNLSIDNLQNTPVPELVYSDDFKKVVSTVKELHLSICTEYNEHGPDQDAHKEERRTFEPFLQRDLLPSMASNLTSLTIKFDQEWGSIPGQFDGRGLSFPRLETLVLENFVIGHHDHLDWVLAQKSLKSLSLKNPRIVTHMRLDDTEVEQWRLRTDDWKRWPVGTFGFEGRNEAIFTFSGTWESVFDSIRTGLPNLVNFHLSDNSRYRPEVVNELSPFRYIVFNIGILPTPLIEVDDGCGFEFAEYYGEDAETEKAKSELATLDSAKIHETGDKRALDDLLKAVKERQ